MARTPITGVISSQNFTAPDENLRAREFSEAERLRKKIEDCEAKGGFWNGVTCEMPQKPATDPQQTAQTTKLTGVGRNILPVGVEPTGLKGEFDLDPTAEGRGTKDGVEGFFNKEGKFFPEGKDPDKQQIIFDEQGNATGVIQPDGTAFFGSEVTEQATLQQGAVAADAQPQPNLAGQVGQFDPLGISPTGLDFEEAFTAGIVQSIPRAIQFGVGGLVLSGGNPIAGAVGFISGLTGGIIGNFKGQRTDTTTAQQRILDEGKQTMKNWATMAAADPANKEFYLGEFNKVAAQIEQAHRQMKLDTSKDLARFETSLPNLAEFNAFYGPGGERSELQEDMLLALNQEAPIDYRLLALKQRLGK